MSPEHRRALLATAAVLVVLLQLDARSALVLMLEGWLDFALTPRCEHSLDRRS